MKHNPRLNEKMARLPGLRRHSSAAAAVDGAGRAGTDADARRLSAGADRHACGRLSPQGGRAWRACAACSRSRLRMRQCAGDTRRVVLVPESAHGTNPATAAFMGYQVKAIPARDDGTWRPRPCEEALGARRRGHHADQSQHLRPVRAGHLRDRATRCTRPAPTSIATAPTSTPSSARCGRATSASMRCTSTCTRRSRRRMAAAVRAPARWCCPRRWRPSRRCPS